MFIVRDLMTKNPVILTPAEDLSLADNIFQLGRIRHLPVVEEGRLVGLVSHRDLLRACGTRRGAEISAIKAREVMTTGVTTVRPTTPLRRAANLMMHNKFGCLPVVEDDKLVGILTETDLVRFTMMMFEELDQLDDFFTGLEPLEQAKRELGRDLPPRTR